ncbi:hypothetical protein [Mesorhizobium tianshanense]|nr:hypothetical protein [Mesorhizobium tianshanense]
MGSEALLDRIAEQTGKAMKSGKRGRRGKEKWCTVTVIPAKFEQV